MICLPCRDRLHSSCPEVARQMDATLSDTDRLASALCNCQHRPAAPVANP